MRRRGSGAGTRPRVDGKWGSPIGRGLFRCAVAFPRPRVPASPLLWLVVMVVGALPKPAAAQSDRCVFQIDNVERQGSVVETPQGTNYFAGGNVRLSCRGSQITMQSDSVAAYGGNLVRFIGNVKYRDSTLTMDADYGTYYKASEKWEARGRVEHSEPQERLDPDGAGAGLLPGSQGCQRHPGDVCNGAASHPVRQCRLDRPRRRAVRHRRRSGPLQRQRSAVGRREGHYRPERLCGSGRLASARHGDQSARAALTAPPSRRSRGR